MDVVQPVTASLKLSWTVTSPVGDAGRGEAAAREVTVDAVDWSLSWSPLREGWERGRARGEEHARTGMNRGGTAGSLVTGLGGSPDPIAVSFRGGANAAHVSRPGPRVPGGGDRTSTGIDFHKIFFHPPFLSSFLPPSPRFLLPVFRVLSVPLFLSLATAGVSVSFPPCRVYNVRPDRTWIRRSARSFLMDIFGYPHRLESDLWTTPVYRLRFLSSLAPRESFPPRIIPYMCVCTS